MQPPYQQSPYSQYPPDQYPNTTKYPSSLEPTQAAYSSNYETTEQAYLNPYMSNPYELPSLPPPPPPKSRKWLISVVIALSCLVVILSVVLYTVMQVTLKPGLSQTTPVVTKTVHHYDARSIIQDFQAHDLPLDQLQYGVSINDFVGKDYPTVITLNSSASFIDPRGCNGPCDIGSVWLGVYNSSIDAQSEYKGLVNYEAYQAQTPGPGPGALASIVQVGRCILIGESDTSDYATILRNDCA